MSICPCGDACSCVGGVGGVGVSVCGDVAVCGCVSVSERVRG